MLLYITRTSTTTPERAPLVPVTTMKTKTNMLREELLVSAKTEMMGMLGSYPLRGSIRD